MGPADKPAVIIAFACGSIFKRVCRHSGSARLPREDLIPIMTHRDKLAYVPAEIMLFPCRIDGQVAGRKGRQTATVDVMLQLC